MPIPAVSNPLDEMRQKVMEIVNADDFMKSLNCFLDEKGDLDTKIEGQLAKLGLAMSFEIEKGTPEFPAVGAFKMTMKASFSIFEHVLINRDPNNTEASGKTAADVIVRLYELFHPMRRKNNPITLGDWTLIEDASSVVTYNVEGKIIASWTPKQEE